MLPCVIFEDEHLLVINKPAGINTHAPGPYAGEGIYDWLRNREPRWASLAIIHRLDKETSGVMVFGKTATANRSLTEQFTERKIQKKYLLLTDYAISQREFVAKSSLVRAGEKYVNRPMHKGGEIAETRFRAAAGRADLLVGLDARQRVPTTLVEAMPLTGRTHQIRVHAASSGFPILGDTLYGGSPFPRVCLHAAELALKHPVSGEEMTFQSKADFDSDTRLELRDALIDSDKTNAFRVVHGASDGSLDWYVDRLGNFLLSQSERPVTVEQQKRLQEVASALSCPTVYHKILNRQIRRTSAPDVSPQLLFGQTAPERFVIRENGVQLELSFNEGYSVGLFLDQRDNRHRVLTGYVAPEFLLDLKGKEVLNTFAYTCGFSVCAALAGARVTSLDLSKKYLEWGKHNFTLNDLDASQHDFIYGDVFVWLKRLAKKSRAFDAIILDPPTFSQSKESGAFRVEKDYGKLVAAALPLIKPEGVLFASSNAAGWPPEDFLEAVEKPIRAARREIFRRHYAPQPPDFPVSRAEPAYLKTVWMRIG